MDATRKRFWSGFDSGAQAEAAWDQRARKLKTDFPLRGIKHDRLLPGIRPKTKKHLRWKALRYLVQHDENRVLRFFWRRPLEHFAGMIRSYLRQKSYVRDDDFFLYGFDRIDTFRESLLADNTLFLVGFSYCHKPFECPSGRFNDECIHDPDNPICGQCFIGKCIHAMPEKKAIPVIIPTVHYIAEKVIAAMEANPGKRILFMITACELTLEMFGDWGNMIGVKGIGVRLDGQICNTMRAFEASENGIKPGLAIVLDETQQRVLQLISIRGLKS